MKDKLGAEIWADGYSFIEFERTGTGLVPYHYETRPTLSQAVSDPADRMRATAHPLADALGIKGMLIA